MQIPLLHQQILLSTERLREIHRTMMNHASSIPSAEIDNLLQEIRQLYSITLDLHRENSMNLLNEASAVFQNTKEVVLNNPENAPLKEKVAITNEPVIQKTEPVVVRIQTDPKAAEKKKIIADVQAMFPEKTSIGERFADHQTFGERIANGEHKKTLSENLKAPVKDLKSAIGLNEKFQFINQLFKGDSKKYNETIAALNNFSTNDEAIKYLHEISEVNNWEDHSGSAKSFFDLLARRYSG